MNQNTSEGKQVDTYLEQLKKDIEIFLEQYLPYEPRFDIKSSKHKVVHDGLWGTLKLSPSEIYFTDTPLIQRLRQIHQTGFSYLTYPSTTHTRFEHTLGVMLQIEKLGNALKNNPDEKRLGGNDLTHMRLAALFHDIGHGPFSHTSEEIYGAFPEFEKVLKSHSNAKPHELIAHLILKSERFKEFGNRVAQSSQIDFPIDCIADYIIGESSDKIYKRELINGPFDADKLDYLFRDSHFSGLPLSVDLDRLWYTVRIASANGNERLMVTQSGSTSLEQILFSKMVLFTTVYQHHKVRTCDCMFAGIIEYMRENGIPLKLKDRNLTWESPIDFLWITDNEFLSYGFETLDKDLHALIYNLFFRRLLKRALIISKRTIEESTDDDDRWDQLQRHAKKSSESAKERRELARAIWEKAGKPCLLQEVWVDLPELPSMRSAEDTFVLPAEGEDIEPITLHDLFPTDTWAKQYGMNKWRGHVFCPPKHQETIGRAAKGIIEDKFKVTLKDEAFLWCKTTPPK